jgi:hypothetical protein
MTCSLYGDLKAAGVEMDSHESDLYFKDTPESRAILARFPYSAKIASKFLSGKDGLEIWWEAPFAFLPWWEAQAEVPAVVPDLIEPGELND